jgi:hypothetical protein
MKKLLMLGAAALLISTSAVKAEEAPAAAPDAHPHKGKYFERLDADSDGIVTKDEFNKHHEGRFADMDEDGDGKITRAEAQKNAEEWKAQMRVHKEQMNQEHMHKDDATKGVPPAAE